MKSSSAASRRIPSRDSGEGPHPALLLLLCAGLVLLVAVAFAPVAGNGFIDYDDPACVTANPHVQAGLTLETIVWAFRTGHHGNWHPLTWLSHALDCELFGLRPAGHHLVSLGLHALNCVLLLLALFRMTKALWRSAAVAALFAVHPLHVESVAWAAERKDVLSTFVFFLILLVYTRHAERASNATRCSLPLLLALGLMAKPMLVTVPFILLLLDFWPLGRWRPPGGTRAGRDPVPLSRLLMEKLPLFALAAASSVITWAVQRAGGAVSGLDEVPAGARLANAVVAYGTYLARTLCPARLGVLYPLAPLPEWEVAVAFAVLAAITAAVLASVRRAPALATGWFWYLGTLVPVIGLVQVGVQSTADRYTYVPLIGIFLMLAWALPERFGARPAGRWTAAVGAGLVLAACAVATWRQTSLWRDSETLFNHTLSITGDNYVIQSNLGGVLTREDRLDEAMKHLEEARRIRPDHAPTLSNLGVVLQGKGRIGEAIALYREALKVKPDHVEAWLNLANALNMTGDRDGALAALREAQRLAPGEAAIGEMIRAVELGRPLLPTPGRTRAGPSSGSRGVSPEARAGLERGNAMRDQGRLDEAAAAYRDALRRDPGFAEAHNNLGSVLGRQGRNEEALAEISKALELAPNLPGAHNNMGILLALRGDTDQAARHFETVIRLDPRDTTAHFNLGLSLMGRGQNAEAIPHLEEVLRIEPGSAEARRALAEARRRAATP